jgi:hypothetical protein
MSETWVVKNPRGDIVDVCTGDGDNAERASYLAYTWNETYQETAYHAEKWDASLGQGWGVTETGAPKVGR